MWGHPSIDPTAEKNTKPLAKGLPAGPGGAFGKIVFTAEDAVEWKKKGEKVILVREETNPEDVEGMRAAQAILTARGGMTSHAALVARGWGKCCIVGCGSLTIDIKMQEAAFEALEGKRGALVMIDSKTGEVLALASSPGFDANKFISGKGINHYFTDKAKPLLNRVIQSTYALGSTFKPILAVAALQEEKMRASKTFLCSGAKRIGQAIFRCAHIHGEQDLYEAIQHSCNVYFYNAGLLVGPNLISKWAHRFGLDKYTDIDLPYEKKGIVPSPDWKRKNLNEGWYSGDTLNFSIGQGFVETTPIELLVAINAIANGGYIVRPHLLKAIDDVESTLEEQTFIGIDKEVIEEVTQGMRLVVSEPTGTANYLKRLGMGIAGKTGTAQNPKASHGWFVGFFPYNDPQYTFCVLLEHSGSSHYAVRAAYRFLRAIRKEGLL